LGEGLQEWKDPASVWGGAESSPICTGCSPELARPGSLLGAAEGVSRLGPVRIHDPASPAPERPPKLRLKRRRLIRQV
jgi:hypothetical protein